MAKGSFASADKQIGNRDDSAHSAQSSAMGGTITSSPVFSNGADARINAGAASNSASGAGATAQAFDYKLAAMIGAVVLVLSVIITRGKRGQK